VTSRQLRRIGALTRSDDSDPLPLPLVATSVALSIVAVAVGGTLGWSGLVASLAANLVLLGPGLLLTNVLLKARRRATIARRSREAMLRIMDEIEAMPRLLCAPSHKLSAAHCQTSRADQIR